MLSFWEKWRTGLRAIGFEANPHLLPPAPWWDKKVSILYFVAKEKRNKTFIPIYLMRKIAPVFLPDGKLNVLYLPKKQRDLILVRLLSPFSLNSGAPSICLSIIASYLNLSPFTSCHA
jgi:hypothetical protein